LKGGREATDWTIHDLENTMLETTVSYGRKLQRPASEFFAPRQGRVLAALKHLVIAGAATACLFSGQAFAQCTTYPYPPLADNTTADAVPVMADLNAINNCAAPLASPYFSGNVGIGTSTPGNLLEVKNSGASSPGIRINNTTAWWQLGVGVNAANDSSFGIYNQNAGNAFVINNSGNVGIGTTTPGAPLSLGSAINTIKLATYDGNGVLYGIGVNGGQLTFGAGLSSASGTPQMVLTSGGNVGIGTTSPATRLDVNGNAFVEGGQIYLNDSYNRSYQQVALTEFDGDFWLFKSNSLNSVWSLLMEVDMSGNMHLGGGLYQYSDASLKTGITPISSPLQKITQINGVTYHWKDPSKNQGEQIGVIAQDVEKVFPQAVATEADGKKSVNYSALIGPLIEAVKEQQKEIATLQAQVAALQGTAAH